MFVLRMVVRRMFSRPLLTLSFLLGLLLVTGIAASIPIYTDGAMRRFLQQELSAPPAQGEERPDRKVVAQYPPGSYWFSSSRGPNMEPVLRSVTRQLDQELNRIMGTEVNRLLWMGQVGGEAVSVVHDLAEPPLVLGSGPFGSSFRLAFQTGFAEKVDLTPAPPGPMPEPWPANWLPEVEGWVSADSVARGAWQPGDLILFDTDPLRPGTRILPIRVAATFRPRNPADLYWYDHETFHNQPGTGYYRDQTYAYTVIVPQAVFFAKDQRGQPLLTQGASFQWRYHYNPEAIDPWRAGAIAESLSTFHRQLQTRYRVMPEVSPVFRLRQFDQKARDLSFPLLLFTLPLLAQLTYYLWLTARLAVVRSAGEIAMLRSRGASWGQVVFGFLVEALLLAAVAAALGPVVGGLLARGIGASAGFLHFVIRQSLPLQYVPAAWKYAAGAAVLGLVAVLPPAMQAARMDILSHRRRSSRADRPQLWQGMLLGLALLGLTAYAYLRLGRLQQLGQSGEVMADPVLLLAPALGIYGVGVLTVFLVPLASSLVSRLLAPLPGAVPYLPFLHLARQPNLYTPLMLLVALTVGLGVNNSLTAETLDRLTVDRTRYQVGTDLRLVPQWPEDPSTGWPLVPRDSLYAQQPGVRAAARLVRGQVAVSTTEGETSLDGAVLAVDPEPFRHVAHLRRDLTPYRLDYYLLWLAEHPEGVLVTPGFLAQSGLQVGDWIALRPQFKPVLEPPAETAREAAYFRILATVPHWPSLYEAGGNTFFVVNREMFQAAYGTFAEEVWLRLEPGADPAGIVQGLLRERVGVTEAHYAALNIYRQRLAPERVGLNGILTLSFLAGVLITLLAFWIHAGTALQARLPRFGVMRALGLSRLQLAATLVWEVGLSVLTAVLIGTGGGMAMARLFLPLLDTPGPRSVPPLLVVGRLGDLGRLYLLTGLILVVVLGWLLTAAGRLRLHIAVKLGQEE